VDDVLEILKKTPSEPRAISLPIRGIPPAPDVVGTRTFISPKANVIGGIR
jgi:hypothetical protein